MISSEDILGFPVTSAPLKDCLNKILHWLDYESGVHYLACANSHSIDAARRDPEFLKSLTSADLLIPDGMGVVLASRILKGQIRQRITGNDIFIGLNEQLNKRETASCFFLGSTEKTLDCIVKRIVLDFPRVRVVGTYSPPFRSRFTPEEESNMVKVVNEARPDVLWVGMTAPKQEKWIHHQRNCLDVKFIGAIGAVFDFYAGTVRRSSPWLQKHGLEWLSRSLREPRRLWKRTLISIPLFLTRVIWKRATMAIESRR
jgi:N-acetylglucosaminyldiphosphoundecaprenol N-acetyl-beta-D-mannosaminyltransferase